MTHRMCQISSYACGWHMKEHNETRELARLKTSSELLTKACVSDSRVSDAWMDASRTFVNIQDAATVCTILAARIPEARARIAVTSMCGVTALAAKRAANETRDQAEEAKQKEAESQQACEAPASAKADAKSSERVDDLIDRPRFERESREPYRDPPSRESLDRIGTIC